MKKKHTFSYLCFRVIRFLVWLFYPKMTVEGTENLPPDACIVVGNHTQMNGPICGELYFPGKRKIWCAHQMMYIKEVPAYAFRDFWSGKPKWTHLFYRVLSYIIAPIAACVFQNAYTIPVFRDNRLITKLILEEENRIEAMNNDRKSKKFKEGSLSYHADLVRRFNEFGKDN